MNTSKAIILTIVAIVTIAIILLVINLILRKCRAKGIVEGKFKMAFGVWYAGLFLPASLISARMIVVFSEAIDNISKINSKNLIIESARVSSLFIGISALWFVAWYFVINNLSIFVTGKRNDEKEIESDNYSYFLIKSIMLTGITICVFPVLEIILRELTPSIQLPFYH